MICPLCEKELPEDNPKHFCFKDNTELFRRNRTERNAVADSEFPEFTHDEDFFDSSQEIVIGDS